MKFLEIIDGGEIMADELVLSNSSNSGNLEIKTIDDLGRISKMMASSGFFSDCRDAAQAGVKILAGLELGFPAFASLTGIHVINGKPVMSANLMAAAIKRSGRYNYRVRELSDEVCELEIFERIDGQWVPAGVSKFSIEDAKSANLSTGKNAETWRKFTKNMLFARAVSNAVRWYAADIFLGAPVYTPDEVGLSINSDGEAIEASVVTTVNSTVATIDAVATIDEKASLALYKEATSLGWLKADLKAMVLTELGVDSMKDLPVDLVDEYRRLISDTSTKASYNSRGGAA